MTCQADCFKDENYFRPIKSPMQLVWSYFEVSNDSPGTLEKRQFNPCPCGCERFMSVPPAHKRLHESLQTTRQDDEEAPPTQRSSGKESTPQGKGPANRSVYPAVSFVPRTVWGNRFLTVILRVENLTRKRKMSLRAHWILRILAVLVIAILWYLKH